MNSASITANAQARARAQNPNPPSTEIFYFEPSAPEPCGYYWWFRWPHELPCSGLNGPFASESEAIVDAALIAGCDVSALPRIEDLGTN